MAIAIQCLNHKGYNGAKEPGQHCEACWQIYAISRSVNAFPGARVVQPINLVQGPFLGMATTGQLLEELKARATVDGTINYKSHGGE
jgi:hypothetical protein